MNQKSTTEIPASRLDLNPDTLALGIRQPWGELILLGKKTLEIRTQPTNMRGVIYLYVGKTVGSEDYVASALDEHKLNIENLGKQGLVGSVEILSCRPCRPSDAKASCVPWEVMEGKYAWELTNPVRFQKNIPVVFLPYGVWFYPFKRRQSQNS
jgi:hypothetical protein